MNVFAETLKVGDDPTGTRSLPKACLPISIVSDSEPSQASATSLDNWQAAARFAQVRASAKAQQLFSELVRRRAPRGLCNRHS